MASPVTHRVISLVAAGAFVLAACGSDDNANITEDVSVTSSAESATAHGPAQPDPDELSGVCFSPVVVQTDWYPQAEHGGIYELLGDDYTVDATRGATTGSLVYRGVDTGVDLEIRAGGPFIDSPVVTEMFLDGGIMFGYVGTDVALSRYAETPTLAVFNALVKNPQVILWNADKHPDANTIANIATEVPAVSVYRYGPFVQFLVEQGAIPFDIVDANYKGNLLLATDDVAHQGFATSEPFRYANLDSGAVQTAYQLVHDAGWTSYPQNLAINKFRLEALRPCLTKLVPMMQQAQIDFVMSPDRTVATLLDVVTQFATTWSQSAELAAYAVDTMMSLGIVGNGDTATFGDFESPRIDDFIASAIPILREQGLNVPDLTAADVATNEFLDKAISLP
jgi:predicted small secreted protein